MNTIVCSDNVTRYEHILVLTCFAHSQQFFLTVSGMLMFLLQIGSLRQ